MKEKFKEIISTVKDNLIDVKDSIVEFGEDTVDYLEDHPWVISVAAFGALRLIGMGVNLAQRGNIEIRKDGLKEIYTNKFIKLEKKMDFNDWFDYLEQMYDCKWNRKKQKAYLKENGFIK